MATAPPSRWTVYSRTMRYYRPYYGAIVGALVFVLLSIGLNLLKPWPFKVILDDVLGRAGPAAEQARSYHNLTWLLWLCLAMVGIHLFWGVFNLINSYLQVKIGLNALARVRCDLFTHLQQLSLKFHDTHRSADSMFRVSYDAQAIQTIFNRGFSTVFSAAITLVSTAVIMVRMDWELTLLALCIAPILLYAIYFFADRIRRQSTAISESESSLSSQIQEGLTGIRIVHAFGREDYEVNRFQEQCLQSLRSNLRLTFTHVSSALVVGTLMGAGTAAMIYIGARHVVDGALTIGDLWVFITYLGMLYDPLQNLSYTSWALEGAAAGAQRVFEVLDTPDEVRDRPDAKPLKATRGAIEFANVAFGYDSARMVLEDVSLKIEPGQTVAFVGTTGAGKTTLLSLIPRFYDPNSGVVKLDGQDIRSFKKKSLRDHMGIVLQDTMLLGGSIAGNIGYGRLTASRAEIEQAARAARIHDFVVSQPKGYDTEAGERGVRLSVGQRQRIGIARAFLKNAPILLLDEPTSALDPQTESEIMRTLKDLMRGRTTIIVTHRIATVHECDRIFVLENGRVAESGAGPDLLKQAGTYAKLYQAQVHTAAGKSNLQEPDSNGDWPTDGYGSR